jgi:hypothetical protein
VKSSKQIVFIYHLIFHSYGYHVIGRRSIKRSTFNERIIADNMGTEDKWGLTACGEF